MRSKASGCQTSTRSKAPETTTGLPGSMPAKLRRSRSMVTRPWPSTATAKALLAFVRSSAEAQLTSLLPLDQVVGHVLECLRGHHFDATVLSVGEVAARLEARAEVRRQCQPALRVQLALVLADEHPDGSLPLSC